jgi:hypothetical protein
MGSASEKPSFVGRRPQAGSLSTLHHNERATFSSVHKKQRHTEKRIFERLQALGSE